MDSTDFRWVPRILPRKGARERAIVRVPPEPRGTPMADARILETFPNPAPKRDYVIEHVHHEFTSICPVTGHPDFGSITVRYVAAATCIELKSLKLYFHGFRNEGIFFEAVTNKICDDLGGLLKPRSLSVVSSWKGRGGITSTITAEWKGARRR